MKSSSIHLWSISLLSAVLAPLASAQAGWLDGAPVEHGWYDDGLPPVYAPRRPVVSIPSPQDGGVVVRTRDGNLVVIYPEEDDGYGLAPEMAPGQAAPPRLRPRKRVGAIRRPAATVGDDVVIPRPPAIVGNEPVVVPSIGPKVVAPRNAVRIVPAKPKPAQTRDAVLTLPQPAGAKFVDPLKKPVQPQGTATKIITIDPPKVAQARIALPVPRPNLESMDFAAVKPILPQDKTAGEDRR